MNCCPTSIKWPLLITTFLILPLLDAQCLLLEDTLTDSTIGQSDGPGQFIPGGGWKSTGGKIVYDAGHPVSAGYFEATMRGWTAPAQGIDKAHPLSGWEFENQYTRIDQQGSYFNWRIGTGYYPFKVLAKPDASGTRQEARVGNVSMVNDGQPHVYRVAWQDGRVTFSLDGIHLISWTFPRFRMRYFTIGRDDWYGITNPAPVFSDIRIVDLGLPPADSLRILTGTLPDGQYLRTYSGAIQAAETPYSYQWITLSEILPPGLAFDAASGILGGVPRSSGHFSISVAMKDTRDWTRDDTASFAFTVHNQKPLFISDETVETVTNQDFAFTVRAVDPDGNPLEYTLTEHPEWISGADSTVWGQTPDTPQTAVLEWRATDGDLDETFRMTLRVLAPDLQILADTFPKPAYLEPFLLKLNAAGGLPPYHWSVRGTLPQGLGFDGDSAAVHGIPLESGPFMLTVHVTDSHDPADRDSLTIALNIDNQAPRLFLPDQIYFMRNRDYAVPVNSYDPDGNPVTIRLKEGPAWISLNDTTLSGNPPETASDTTAVIEVTDGDLSNTYTVLLTVESGTGLGARPGTGAVTFDLKQNYPNPLNPDTQIDYSVAETCSVILKLFNMRGELIWTVAEGIREPGRYRAVIDGHTLPAGIYMYAIDAGNYRAVKKMLVVK
ncbi:T9SS type A sorting domain-containing protein [bacterium]|nr:T9SS type A sorting domain-containing protein [bacterium]